MYLVCVHLVSYYHSGMRILRFTYLHICLDTPSTTFNLVTWDFYTYLFSFQGDASGTDDTNKQRDVKKGK